MSYREQKTGNGMNDYFIRLRDFYHLVQNLQNAKTPRTFELWLDKLIRIDRRSLVLWLKKNRDNLPEAHWKKAVGRIKQLED